MFGGAYDLDTGGALDLFGPSDAQPLLGLITATLFDPSTAKLDRVTVNGETIVDLSGPFGPNAVGPAISESRTVGRLDRLAAT